MVIMSPSSSSTSSSSSSSSRTISLAIAVVAGAALTAYTAIRRFKKQQPQQRGQQQDDDDDDNIMVVAITLPSWATATAIGDIAVDHGSEAPSSCFDIQRYAKYKFTSDDEMMAVAILLSDANVRMSSGGPFGAAIFERHYYSDDEKFPSPSSSPSYCTLVSIGMNRVVPLNNSTCHGEMVAIQLAQKKMGSFTLNMTTISEEEIANHHPNEDTVEGGEKKEKCSQRPPQQQPPPTRRRQFELFTSCEPCAMCLGATLWSGVSRIVCAATKDDAQAIGFDEGPVYESSYAHLESCGVQVTRGVMREEAQRVLRMYAETGLIYNR